MVGEYRLRLRIPEALMPTDEHTLACLEDDRRPPVVLVHAFPLDGRMWDAQRNHLAAHTRVLAPDLPGFGASAGHPAGPDLDAWADALERLLAGRLGPRPAIVCGLSMGGYVALRLAGRHPARLAGLVLADTRARADDAAGRRARDEAIDTVSTDGVAALVETLLPKLLAEESPDELRGRVRDLALQQSREAVVAALRAMRDRPDSTPVLERVRVPTLVVAGEHDALTPPHEAAAMAARLPAGKLVVIEGAGHLSNLERPDLFTAAVTGLVDRVAPATAIS